MWDFCWTELAMGQVFIPVHGVSPVIVVPSVLRGHFYVNTTVIGRTSGRRLGTLKQKVIFQAEFYLHILLPVSVGL
jgi:hypothetical protein